MITSVRSEKGVTVVEVLGTLVVFGLVLMVCSRIFFLIAQASALQGKIVGYQQTANMIVAQVESIAKMEGIYQHAGYLGKYDSQMFHEEHIVKVMPEGTLGENITDSGNSRLILTDINDINNIRGRIYDTKDSEVKLKVIQQKNENEATRTHFYFSNYRDTFTIQTKFLILFYTKEIDFFDYYNNTTGWWRLEDLLTDNSEQIIYKREFTIQYRDDEKSRGGVPGNGRW